jgi:hypothetical protein
VQSIDLPLHIKATVVLIESRKPERIGPPVRDRNIYVKPFRLPIIEKILSQSAAGQPIVENQKILKGYRLILRGTQFQNEIVQVDIGGVEVDPVISNMSIDDTTIAFNLPDDLSSGLHQIQIVHHLLMGSPPARHKGTTSRGAGLFCHQI